MNELASKSLLVRGSEEHDGSCDRWSIASVDDRKRGGVRVDATWDEAFSERDRAPVIFANRRECRPALR